METKLFVLLMFITFALIIAVSLTPNRAFITLGI